MPSQILQLNNISFSYDSLSKPIFQSVTVNINNGWTCIIGANGSGKTTFLKLCINELKAQKGNVINPHFCVYCKQRTDYCPENIEDFIFDYSKEAKILKRDLDIDTEFLNRWNTLSQGERKRLQIGNALYLNPDLLAVDEPTNHLDIISIECLENALKNINSALLLVSHEKTFLNNLTTINWHIEKINTDYILKK